MRKFVFLATITGGLYAAVLWWRRHPRTGADFMNRVINPWLERRGLMNVSGGELGLIEHVGRRSGTVRRTPVHPVPTADGFRIIVPVGEQSQWARNVLADGHCRLILGDTLIELDEPVLERATEVAAVPRPVAMLFDWLGFRYLRLRRFSEAPVEDVVQATVPEAVEHEVLTA